MVTIAVKCPICGNIKKLNYKPKYFFHCCGMSHEVDKFKLVETDFNALKSANSKSIEEEPVAVVVDD